MEESKPKVLYVDDEEDNLTVFKSSFRRYYDIYVSTSGSEGIKIALENDFDVIITDQRMPGMTGVEFLKQLPDNSSSMRMVLTGYSDISAVIEAINSGKVYKYITKPWDKDELKITIDQALEVRNLKKNNELLIAKLKNANEQLEQTKVSLEKVVKERTDDLVRRNEELYHAKQSLNLKALQLEEKNNELEKINKELEKMNKELAAFAYLSSHDLQEPLRKIQTFSSRILEIEEDRLSVKSKDYFGRIQNSAARMRNLIEDLLAYSRVNSAKEKLVLTDLHGLIEEVQGELKETFEQKNAVLEYDTLPHVPIIPFQFHQLLINILTNALKFTRPDVIPRIVIKADVVDAESVSFYSSYDHKQYHHISISDNGIGFATEYSTKIFEIFQRLHTREEYVGTGVGLTICKKIMDNHEGFITAEEKATSKKAGRKSTTQRNKKSG